MKRTLVWTAALLLTSSLASAQGGYTVTAGNSPVAPANPPQGAIAVMPSQPGTPGSRVVGPEGVRAPRRPEEYGGVAPGAAQVPPGMRRLARLRNPGIVVAWPGFQMVPGGSRVFVVSTAGAAMQEVARAGAQRTYFFPRARLFLSNNGRPLETVAFETPVVRARLRAVRGGVNLILDLRADVTPRMGSEPASPGLMFHYLEFPPFTVSEVARIRLPNGLEISATPQGAPVPPPPPPPGPGGPVIDNERPPPVRP